MQALPGSTGDWEVGCLSLAPLFSLHFYIMKAILQDTCQIPGALVLWFFPLLSKSAIKKKSENSFII